LIACIFIKYPKEEKPTDLLIQSIQLSFVEKKQSESEEKKSLTGILYFV
jgi:hypothetical protein